MIDDYWQTVKVRLSKYGYDHYDAFRQVELFFSLSMVHYGRQLLGRAIADWYGLDLKLSAGRDELIERIIEMNNPYRGEYSEWRTGLEDIPLGVLQLCAAKLHLTESNFKPQIKPDLMDQTRFAIARTITFLRVLPPKSVRDATKLPDADSFPRELPDCWRFLKGHAYVRWDSKRTKVDKNGRIIVKAALNQHALDSVNDRFGTSLCLEPAGIGPFKKLLLARSREPLVRHWFWPYMTFKWATEAKLVGTNRRTENPNAHLWNPACPGYPDLWGISQ